MRVNYSALGTVITSSNPPEVMKHASEVLLEMGLEVQEERQYKVRCVRPKRREFESTSVSLKDGQGGDGFVAISMVDIAASGGVSVSDKLLPL